MHPASAVHAKDGLPLPLHQGRNQNSQGKMHLLDGEVESLRQRTNERHLLKAILGHHKGQAQAINLPDVLLQTYGTLAAILAASYEDLITFPGLTTLDAELLKSTHDVMLKVAYLKAIEGPKTNLDSIITLALLSIGNSPVEKVELFYLRETGILLGTEIICSGSECGVSVSPRTIMMAACRRQARAIVMAHNHPNGSVLPSDQDLRATAEIMDAGTLLNVKVVDHIIVSGAKWYSFRAAGLV